MKNLRLLAFVVAGVLVAIILAADLGLARGLFAAANRLPGADTAGHFLLLGMLSFIMNIAFPSVRVKPLPFHKTSLVLAIIITIEEFTQLFLANRTFSLIDLSANYAGIWLFGELGVFLRGKLAKDNPISMA